MIKVEHSGNGIYRVTVEKASTTQHDVTLTEDYYNQLTSGSVEPEVLIEKSFEFLLQRESNTMILREFNLPVISRYFNEYEDTIKGML